VIAINLRQDLERLVNRRTASDPSAPRFGKRVHALTCWCPSCSKMTLDPMAVSERRARPTCPPVKHPSPAFPKALRCRNGCALRRSIGNSDSKEALFERIDKCMRPLPSSGTRLPPLPPPFFFIFLFFLPPVQRGSVDASDLFRLSEIPVLAEAISEDRELIKYESAFHP
jgi:hypothetical protein